MRENGQGRRKEVLEKEGNKEEEKRKRRRRREREREKWHPPNKSMKFKETKQKEQKILAKNSES